MDQILPHSSSVNGEPGASVSAADRGLAFGDGVFETVRVVRGQALLWSLHRERLEEGCRRLSIPVQLPQLERWVDELLAQHPLALDGVLKIIVTRGAGGRGYAIDPSLQPTVVCSLHPPPPATPAAQHLYLCQQRLSENPMLAGIKHLNRLENILLKAECQQAGFEEGLVVDTAGHMIEAVSSNVFFERHGEWYTPALHSCGVAGVMRRYILLQLAPDLGIKVHVAVLDLQSLPVFTAGFICNSVRGITPIASITMSGGAGDTRSFETSDLTRQLRLQLSQLQAGW